MRKKVKSKRLRAVPVQSYGGTLTPEQHANLRYREDLMHYGPAGEKQVFANDGERRRAYLEYRDRFAKTVNQGTRIPPFWQYEASIPAELRSFDAWLAAHHPSLRELASTLHPEVIAASGRLSEARHCWLKESSGARHQ